MIDPPTRLRRAINLNDPILVKRLLRTHPSLLTNPDFDSKANTSLHLAASLGFTAICIILLDLGHDSTEISRNADHDVPLLLAAKGGHVETAILLVERCARSVRIRNKMGLDALAMAAQNSASTGLIPVLLSGNKVDVDGRDNEGNTPLHHASASGGLKALRLLLAAGADPAARNAYDWMPVAYSQTVAAEVYFRNLVAEMQRKKLAVEQEVERERDMSKRVGAVRLVEASADMDAEGDDEDGDSSLGVGAGLKRGGGWSPSVERRQRPPTPGGAPGVRAAGDWGGVGMLTGRMRSESAGL